MSGRARTASSRPRRDAAGNAWRSLEQAGVAVRTGRSLHFHREPLDRLVERLDAVKLTVRHGDRHVLRKQAADRRTR